MAQDHDVTVQAGFGGGDAVIEGMVGD